MPDFLVGWAPRLSMDVVATAANAESAVGALNRRALRAEPHPLDTFACMLLRVEAVASSRIEGIELSPRRLLTAEAEQRAGGRSSDRRAVEVLANIEAMEEAIRSATGGGRLRTDDLLEVHRRLMSASARPDLGGWVRDTQNWIGASGYTPVGASFVPPPPEEVTPLLDDLMVYRRRDAAPAFVPPISAVLARSRDSYIDGLAAWRHDGPADDPARNHAADQWLHTFLEATYDACQEAHVYLDTVSALEADLRARAGPVRRGSSADRLLSLLPACPIFSIDTAAAAIQRSTVATGQAVNNLTEARILTVRNVGKQRYRIFEAPEVTHLITHLDRELSLRGTPAAADRAGGVDLGP
ncbi:MAG: hypothetical protein OXF41_08770 [bacterium]|nr:hypothetical protein [bacterium]